VGVAQVLRMLRGRVLSMCHEVAVGVAHVLRAHAHAQRACPVSFRFVSFLVSLFLDLLIP